ncbi:helicase-related protein [Rothia sp. P5764]|uniref:helicase-related protein n=1 Tax=Rothia sp. P5764 TaxID=3402654 RepID=UPI003ACBEC2D
MAESSGSMGESALGSSVNTDAGELRGEIWGFAGDADAERPEDMGTSPASEILAGETARRAQEDSARSGVTGDERRAGGEDAELPFGSSSADSGGETGQDGQGTTEPAVTGEPIDYAPDGTITVPSGARARAEANLDAIELVRKLTQERRYATAEEQKTLAGFSSWGAVPEIFQPQKYPDFEQLNERMNKLMTSEEIAEAEATTLNAHYTNPAVVGAMWRSLETAGFSGGAVIEPGCGSGNFIGAAPESAQMIGVELDNLSAQIAHYLYPSATIRSQGYERARLPYGALSAAIGNVPFGSYVVHDPIDNTESLSIHNYFINKTMKHLAPGGYGAFITSGYTMDAQKAKARALIAEHSDLVAAVRLPDHAFSRVAGARVSTDILVFRKREEDVAHDRKKAAAEWVDGYTVTVDGEKVATSRFFDQHPEYVLGEKIYDTNQFGKTVEIVKSPDNDEVLATRIRVALEGQIAAATENGLGYAPVLAPGAERRLGRFAPGGLVVTENSQFSVSGTVRWEPTLGQVQVYDALEDVWTHARLKRGVSVVEVRELIGLKEQVRSVIDARDDQERSTALESLHQKYDLYVGKYGYINRFRLTSGPKPKKTEVNARLKALRESWLETQDTEGLTRAQIKELEPEPSVLAEWEEEANASDSFRKVQDHLVVLRGDPDYGKLLALENFNDEELVGSKSKLFEAATYALKVRPERAENAADALSISLDELRRVDLGRVAELLNVDEQQAREALGTLVFDDPGTGELIPAVQYLSGDVRTKLATAENAEALNPAFSTNVEALREVLPAWVGIEKIHVQVGASFFSAEQYEHFILDTFKVPLPVTRQPENDGWKVPHRSAGMDASVRHQYGTRRRNPAELLDAVMNNRQPKVLDTVTDEYGNEKKVLNEKETKLARMKAAKIEYAFKQWVVSDSDRVAQVEREYNRIFNSYVAPDYSVLGEHLKLEGISPEFTPHPYQREAVARITHEPAVLLDHVVGAGKTGSMIMGAMELRRRGIANKPLFVVPNHLVEQITREFAQWAPTSNVLMIPTGITPEDRKLYAAKSLAGDWDAVIMPQSVFNRVNISAARQAQFLSEDIEALRLQKEATSGDELSTKTLQGVIKRMETRMAKLMNRKDSGVTFEELGCDYLFVDEAHDYKNLARASEYAELSCAGSMRASDLDYILRALREDKIDASNGENQAPAVVTFATGTPVANSLSELWVMMHYLRPDLAKNMGISSIDAWARVFTKAEAAMEVQPSGIGFRIVNKISEYQNLEQLMQVVSLYTSTVTREQIPQQLPSVIEGGMQSKTRMASEHVQEYMKDIVATMESPGPDDYIIEILGRARRVALDPRMVGLEADDDGGRPRQVAGEVARIYEQYSQHQYLDTNKELSPIPGGLQVLFCDQGTPTGASEFNMYDALKEEMILAGIPGEKIAYIHDAHNDEERGELFKRCRNGEVAVLIGSTQKMGTGMNVQNRLTAIHHVDIPWRPADLEQREGRGLRQGNQNSEIEILSYGTVGTFDAYQWQILERKSKSLNQLKSIGGLQAMESLAGDGDPRMMIASLAGDERVAEYMVLAAEVQNLMMQKNNEISDVKEIEFEIATTAQRAEGLGSTLKLLHNAREYEAVEGDPIIIGDASFDTKGDEAGAKMLQVLSLAAMRTHAVAPGTYFQLGKVGNIPAVVSLVPGAHLLQVNLVDPVSMKVISGSGWDVSIGALNSGQLSGRGQVMRFFNSAAGLSSATERAQKQLDKLQGSLTRLEKVRDDATSAFSGQDELDKKLLRLDMLASELELPSLEVDELEEDSRAEDTTATLTDEEHAKLYGTFLDDNSYSLREGDVIEISKKQYDVGRGLYRVYLLHPIDRTNHERGWKYLVEEGADISSENIFELSPAINFTHVTRLFSAIDGRDKALLSMAPEDAFMRRGSADVRYVRDKMKVGDKLTTFVADETSELPGNPQKAVTGTVKEISGDPSVPYPEFVIGLEDTDGQAYQIKVKRGYGADPVEFIHHDVVDLDAEAEAAAKAAENAERERSLVTDERLYPGDLLRRDIKGLGKRGDAWNGRHKFEDPFTKKSVHKGYGSIVRKLSDQGELTWDDIIRGRDLTEDEMSLILGELTTSAKVSDLRPGDVVNVAVLDPKSGKKGQVRIHSIGMGGRPIIKYRGVDAPAGDDLSSVTRMDGTNIGGIIARRYGALTFDEKAMVSGVETRAVIVGEIDPSLYGSVVSLEATPGDTLERLSGILKSHSSYGGIRYGIILDIDGAEQRMEVYGGTLVSVFVDGDPSDIDARGQSLERAAYEPELTSDSFMTLPSLAVPGFNKIIELDRSKYPAPEEPTENVAHENSLNPIDQVETATLVDVEDTAITKGMDTELEATNIEHENLIVASVEAAREEQMLAKEGNLAPSPEPGTDPVNQEGPIAQKIQLDYELVDSPTGSEKRVKVHGVQDIEALRDAVAEASSGRAVVHEDGYISTLGVSMDSDANLGLARAALKAAGFESEVHEYLTYKDLVPGDWVLIDPTGLELGTKNLPALSQLKAGKERVPLEDDVLVGMVTEVDYLSRGVNVLLEDTSGGHYFIYVTSKTADDAQFTPLENSLEFLDEIRRGENVNRLAVLSSYGAVPIWDIEVGDEVSLCDMVKREADGELSAVSMNEVLVIETGVFEDKEPVPYLKVYESATGQLSVVQVPSASADLDIEDYALYPVHLDHKYDERSLAAVKIVKASLDVAIEYQETASVDVESLDVHDLVTVRGMSIDGSHVELHGEVSYVEAGTGSSAPVVTVSASDGETTLIPEKISLESEPEKQRPAPVDPAPPVEPPAAALGEMGYAGDTNLTTTPAALDASDRVIGVLRYSQVRRGDRIADPGTGQWYPVYDAQIRPSGNIAISFLGPEKMLETVQPPYATITVEQYLPSNVYSEHWTSRQADSLRHGDAMRFYDSTGTPRVAKVERVSLNDSGAILASIEDGTGQSRDFVMQPRELIRLKEPLCEEKRFGVQGAAIQVRTNQLSRGDLVQLKAGGLAVVNEAIHDAEPGKSHVWLQNLMAGHQRSRVYAIASSYPATVFEQHQQAEATRLRGQFSSPQVAKNLRATSEVGQAPGFPIPPVLDDLGMDR